MDIPPQLENVESICLYMKIIGFHKIDGAKLFDQTVGLKTIQGKQLNRMIWYFNLLKLCQYNMFAIPAYNVNIERIFLHMNIQWTDEQN